MADDPANDPIKHVIVLMLENRSFDHILGGTQKMRASFDLSGINKYNGKRYAQQPGAARLIANDPVHETSDVLVQLGVTSNVPPNGGFVQSYAQKYPSLTDPSEVMRFHDDGSLPAIHALAAAFTVCDQWHSSVPGPTWVNRLFALSGTSLGRVKMPNGIMNLNLHWYDQPTIFDRLNEKSIGWKVYFGDTPLSLLFVHQWSPEKRGTSPSHDGLLSRRRRGTPISFRRLPSLNPPTWSRARMTPIRPMISLQPTPSLPACTTPFEKTAKLWNSSLLVLLCDEHGGFYDHVSPPNTATPPDHHNEEFDFKRYGVRVPAVLISPYVGNGVFSDFPGSHQPC